MSAQTTFVPAKTNHLLHLVLTGITCGAWGLVWLAVALYNYNRTVPVVSVGVPTYASGQYPYPAMWEVQHGQQYQVSQGLRGSEAQGLQHEESRDDLQRPA